MALCEEQARSTNTFFGEPKLDPNDLLRADGQGHGIISLLEFTGQSGTGDFRIRLIYVQNAKVCAMVGQEIINWASY